jgi:hypothetical protein
MAHARLIEPEFASRPFRADADLQQFCMLAGFRELLRANLGMQQTIEKKDRGQRDCSKPIKPVQG